MSKLRVKEFDKTIVNMKSACRYLRECIARKTQEDFAKDIGHDRRTIQNVESDDPMPRVSLDVLLSYAHYFKIEDMNFFFSDWENIDDVGEKDSRETFRDEDLVAEKIGLSKRSIRVLRSFSEQQLRILDLILSEPRIIQLLSDSYYSPDKDLYAEAAAIDLARYLEIQHFINEAKRESINTVNAIKRMRKKRIL